MPVDLPQSLIESVKRKNCIAFIGSGLSVPAGLPSWRQLLEAMIKEGENEGLIKDGDQLRAELKKDHFLEVSEYVRFRLGPHFYGSVVRQLIDKPSEPTDAHEMIVDTPYRAIITTNYDKLLETAYTLKHRRTPRKITWSQPESLGSVLYEDAFFIFKLHGDVDNIESIVLSRRDYDDVMFRNPHIRTFLQAILMTSTLLFIGYSIHDPDFEIAMAEVPLLFRGTTPVSFALLPNVSEVFKEHYKHRMNIHVIPYDPHDNHIEVTNTIKMIRDAVKVV